MTQADGKAKWERPPEGMIKINTDGALFEDSNTNSYSMIVRNHAGDLVESKASCRQGTVNPEMAELMGIREALSWLKDKDYAGAIVETGLAMVQAIRSSTATLSYLGRVINECKSLLLLSLKHYPNVTLNFVKSTKLLTYYTRRNSNSIA